MQNPRTVQARPVNQPQKPVVQQQTANINTLAAELFEIRKIMLQEQEDRRFKARGTRAFGITMVCLAMATFFFGAIGENQLTILFSASVAVIGVYFVAAT